jgi:hypothetical protein
MERPDLIAHCDWGTPALKRWVVAARRLDEHSYGIGEPEPVADVARLFEVLRSRSPNGPVFVGFDFPIGLPRRYAERAGITSFPETLLRFGEGPWADFYTPANTRKEISLDRPFYPRVPGGTKRQDLVDGLGLQSSGDLLRRCDSSSVIAGVACGIFWTLGANQCGKAAILGWRDVLAPAMRKNEISLWPFDGDLRELLALGKITVGEVYPAAIYPQLGIAHAFGKTEQEARRLQAPAILRWCDANNAALSPRLRSDVTDGFGNGDVGEDKFDALVGVLGMIRCIQSLQGYAVPADPAIRQIEGWMLGLEFEGPGDQIRLPKTTAVVGTSAADATTLTLSPGARAQLCPACHEKVFKRWPWGWDGHAAEKCKGITGSTAEERKRNYRERYLMGST